MIIDFTDELNLLPPKRKRANLMVENLILVRPSLDWEEELLAYKDAFKDEHMHGGAGLYQFDKVSDWLAYLEKLEMDKPAEEGWTATAFLCIRQSDKRMVGICNVRHHLNSLELFNVSGHIGYSIRPDERQKGYAKVQLHLALSEAQKLGIDRGSDETILDRCGRRSMRYEINFFARLGTGQDGLG